MSSSYVRTQIKNYLTTNFPAVKFVDLTGEFEELQNVLKRNNIGLTEGWTGIQFSSTDEEPISLTSSEESGLYREIGIIFLHVVERGTIGVGDTILNKAEALRNSLRSKRIGDIVIVKVNPPNFEAGSTLDFEGGYVSASVVVEYKSDLKL